jgi:predicted transcriptional regulator
MNTKPSKHTNGPELKAGVLELGLSIMAFSRASNVSPVSLRRIFMNIYVREDTRQRAWITLRRFRKKMLLEAPPNISQARASL